MKHLDLHEEKLPVKKEGQNQKGDPVLKNMRRWHHRCIMGFLLALLVIDIVFVLVFVLVKLAKILWG
jgi:uncharacterized protein YqhQ